ncbi:MAG: hypothetical protein ACHREM_09235, partial [Polyangiales bacterium]
VDKVVQTSTRDARVTNRGESFDQPCGDHARRRARLRGNGQIRCGSPAADVLNVSHAYLLALLDDGKIPCRGAGSHRSLKTADLLVYKEQDDVARKAVLDELTAEAEKHGLGY